MEDELDEERRLAGNNGSQGVTLTRTKVRALLNAMDENNVEECEIYRATDGRLVVRQVILTRKYKALRVN